MNILFYNNIPCNPKLGGIERVTDILIKELLSRKRYNIITLCDKTDDSELVDYEYPATVISMPYEDGFENNKNVIFYNNLLKTEHIDIVVNQRGWSFTMNNVLDTKSVKTISVIHSSVDSWITYMMQQINFLIKTPFGYFKYCLKQLIFPFYKSYKLSKFKKQLSNHYCKLLEDSAAVVVLSKNYITDLKRFAGEKSCPIIAIPNPNQYAVQPIEKKDNTIIYVGRLVKDQKRPMRIIKIWQKLYRKHPDWKLQIVGDGPERSRMEAYVKSKGIERVEFEGAQTNVEQYYKKASFVCLTSQFEGWGMTLTEGMSFGCIPFTFNSYGAASDIVDDNINGCLVSPFDLNEYAEKLSYLMCNANQRKRMALEAQIKVQQFSVSNVVDKWETLFNSIRHNA
ncbi:MAG: glycosyltransferase [Muribaculaceae bacterium]